MKFYKIYLELSDVCNLNCSFCTPLKARRGLMPLHLFDNITTQIAKKVNLVSLHILGDPLCVENLNEYLDILEAKNLRFDLVSSGAFLKPKHYEILVRQNAHQLSFSLDSMIDNKLDFKRYFENILGLYDYISKQNFRIYMNLRLFSKYDISEILGLFKEWKYEDSKRRIRLNKYLFLRFHKRFKWGKFMESNLDSMESSLDSKHKKTPHCLGGISQLGVLSNGILVPCCLDARGSLALGDLKTQSFKEILESKKYIDFKTAQLNCINLPKMCELCTFRGV